MFDSFSSLKFQFFFFFVSQATIYVLAGAFEDPDIIHVDDAVDPVRDLETKTEELRLKVLFDINYEMHGKYILGTL